MLSQHCTIHYIKANTWVPMSVWGGPDTIQVVTRETCAIVSRRNAVRVQHRHHVEYDLLPQLTCNLFFWRCQKIEKPVHDPTRRCFPRMHSTGDKDYPSFLQRLLLAIQ